MTSKERLQSSLNHIQPDKIPVDFGSTCVTGIHVLAVERLRDYFGLEKKPVKVIEPCQMLGEIGDDLAEIMHIDVIGLSPYKGTYGFPNGKWKEFKTPWGQVVLVPGEFNTVRDQNGDCLIFPEGDVSAPASGRMPQTGFFFDSIIRQEPIVEEMLDPEENMEEYKLLTETDLQYWKDQVSNIADSTKGIAANFGGTAIGDISHVPAPSLKNPKGIRDVEEWYMSTLTRPDYLRYIFEKQTDIVLENFRLLFDAVGNKIDVLFVCGTDFGTQNSTFCSTEMFDDLYLPFYLKMNNWIHEHTTWKTMKHSCGAVEPFMEHFIKAGFDIINPVQINAAGMDPVILKKKYGDRLVFWGGGVDTQRVLPYGKPADVETHVLKNCEIFSKGGGFVFNTVHNIQANVPTENIVAIFRALDRFNS
ncbi:MAG: uroporphyrinogen decarboxylase family protein [Prolixibacteraceae bacterium]|jgi:uroporphyrinogen-III decarboxylase|nr:uroporphyrinogen decarboxylase family protein [Prolixibacteraceae bacterium]